MLGKAQAWSGGLEVFVPFPGKTLFDELGGFQFRVQRAAPPPGLDRGVVVIPFPHSGDEDQVGHAFAQLAEMWSPSLREAAGRGELRVVVDASPEGIEHSPGFTKQLYRGLHALGVPSDACFVVTQERNFRADYLRYCAKKGFDGRIRILNYDFWIKRFHAQFEDEADQRLARRIEAFAARSRRRDRLFVSLNLSIRAIKLMLLLSLLRDGLWDKGYISFGGLQPRPSTINPEPSGKNSAAYFAERMRKLPGFADLGRELEPLLPVLEAKGPIVLGEAVARDGDGRVQKAPMRPLEREYDDSWFSVITETEMRARRSRITEKPFKSLVNFHPIVVFGNPGALSEIRQLGYATFEEAIDERYDEETDPRRRFDMAYDEVLRLCRMDQDQLAAMEQALREKLIFNAEWGLVHLPRRYRDQLDLELMDQIFAPPEATSGRSPL